MLTASRIPVTSGSVAGLGANAARASSFTPHNTLPLSWGTRRFFNQVLGSGMLSGLAIYLHNDLNFSGNTTLSVLKDMVMIVS